MDNQQPTNAPDHNPAPVFDGSLPHSPIQRSRKSLAIALVVSAVFLLASVGIAAWLMFQPRPSQTSAKPAPTGDGSSEVTKISVTPPATLPATYVRRDENTLTGQTAYYDDTQSSCGFVAKVRPLAAGNTPKQAAVAAASELKDVGVATTANTGAGEYLLKDADGKHEYKFASERFDQTVSLPGVVITKQILTLAYKQFGSQLAAVGYSCPAESWETKSPELETILKTFKLTTER